MTVLRRFWFFLTRWRRLEDLDEEMQLHVEMLAAVNQRRGLPPDAAAREARRRFGNQLELREESRDMWGFSCGCGACSSWRKWPSRSPC